MEYLAEDCVDRFRRLQIGDSLVEDFDDGLHVSTRRPSHRGLCRNTPRMHSGHVLVR